MTPFIIVGGILLGWFTATESAAAAVIYAAVLSIFFYREMDAKKLWDALLETGKLSAIALFCVGTASVFGWLLAYFQIPKALLENVTSWGLGLVGVGSSSPSCSWSSAASSTRSRRSSSSAPRCSRSPSRCTCIRCRSRSSASSRWPSARHPAVWALLMISCAIAKVRLRYALKDTLIMLVPMLLVLAMLIIWPQIPLWLPSVIRPDFLK
jgi:TRAP-type C4-dicarboxylate transport system permease large subunit